VQKQSVEKRHLQEQKQKSKLAVPQGRWAAWITPVMQATSASASASANSNQSHSSRLSTSLEAPLPVCSAI